MKIEDLRLGDVIKLAESFSRSKDLTTSFQIGKRYFIRGVNYYIGELVEITDYNLVLRNASWVADTGRFSNAMKTGELSEVEPYASDVIVPLGSIFDACEWSHGLPDSAK